MQDTFPFQIYNASAGSGKTYTLVKEYIKLLVQSKSNDAFASILAITFTNKAVNEMKSRVIKTLTAFTNPQILAHPSSMFTTICQELSISPESLHVKSGEILQSIVHNYSALSISTIDGFTHKLIRTFAKDLQLSQNFEVELDTSALLNEAVETLISKTGEDSLLTEVLVNFALEKVDEDKSWDVSYDLNQMAKRLTDENDLIPLATLKDKSLQDFEDLKIYLKESIKTLKNTLTETSNQALEYIASCGLEHSDFSGGYLPKYFVNLAAGNFRVSFESKWQLELEEKPLYPGRVSGATALTMDRIQPELVAYFYQTKESVINYHFHQAIYKNINPLSVLNLIHKSLEQIKLEENKIPISEFNSIISNEIKHQPTPFIYERLGEKFKHYFIDEFQDTSMLQWENLIPLISNSLEQEQNEKSGSLLLVGDAKQAIYRWRGGKAEQFIDLYHKKATPFQVKQKVENLAYNYRSCKEIVTFNNHFFSFLATEAFTDPLHQELYLNAPQKPVKNTSGFVSLQFINHEDEEDANSRYCEEVLSTINQCLDNGFSLKDLCVLVRKKDQGILISQHLIANHIPIISSETLLLKNSETVSFLNAVLTLIVQPKNEEAKVTALYFIAQKYGVNNVHDFMMKHFKATPENMFCQMKTLGIHLSLDMLLNQSLYDCVETLVSAFELHKNADAYLQFYLDTVLEFTHKRASDIKGFLTYFEQKKDSLSIALTENQNAVKIMTIHKAKGLEFPVVIFPFASLDIYKDLSSKMWFPLGEKFSGFSTALVNFNKELASFGETGESLYNSKRHEQELDTINLLYVALTRPSEQLYIISKSDLSKKNGPNKRSCGGLLIAYLIKTGVWNDSQLRYTFGTSERAFVPDDEHSHTLTSSGFISVEKARHNISIITKAGLLWDTAQSAAIEKGNVIHQLLSKIKTHHHLEQALHDSVVSGEISEAQSHSLKSSLEEIITHPKLAAYFTDDTRVFNEKEILTPYGEIVRPDKLVFTATNEVVLLDYKTGAAKPNHITQLENYATVLKDMHLKVTQKILVYINDTITIKEL